MPLPLGDPATTAVVFIECQNGTFGPNAAVPSLQQSMGNLLDRLVVLATAARDAGITVIQATCTGRNPGVPHIPAPLYRLIGPATDDWNPDHPDVQVVKELQDDRDLVLPRRRGLVPTHGTDLLPSLRALGAETIVYAGISLNIALTASVYESVEEGFRVVVPRDAAAGTPVEYGEAVLANTIAMMATLTDIAALKAHWAS